jgi:hypothetical protein
MIIYLDYQVFIDVFDNRDPTVMLKIENLKTNGAIFPFSPAHIEELAYLENGTTDNKHIIQERKNIIKLISKGRCIHPFTLNGIATGDRHTKTGLCSNYDVDTCYTNVVGEYGTGLNMTEYAAIEHALVSSHYLQENKEHDDLSKFEASQIILNNNIKDFDAYIQSTPVLTTRYEEECFYQDIFNICQKIGFSPEKTTPNSMHDITHTINASVSDYFVTNDKKLSRKAIIAYSLLNLKTKVISKQDFLNL